MLTIGLTISYLIFGIIPQGSFGLIYLFAAFYLIGLLGIGLLISTAAETQLQANFIGFFVIMFFAFAFIISKKYESSYDQEQKINFLGKK